MNLNLVKRKAAAAMDMLGVNAVGFALQKAFFSPFIRVINYHDVPPQFAKNFEEHLRLYSAAFVNVSEAGLRGFLQGNPWPYGKPGLILSFDDGLASHIETVAPLLEKYGFTGWFFVPAERVTTRSALGLEEEGTDEKRLTREDVKTLDANHVIGSHTTTHCRLSDDLDQEKLSFEIIRSKSLLEHALGHEVSIFCWVGGEEFTYSKAAADLIKEGYDLSFMTNNAVIRPGTNPLQIQRTNIEAENPLSLVKFQLAGFMDIIYSAKRRRVNNLTR